jgi:hypothetical protein
MSLETVALLSHNCMVKLRVAATNSPCMLIGYHDGLAILNHLPSYDPLTKRSFLSLRISTSRVPSVGRSQRFRRYVATAITVADCNARQAAAPVDSMTVWLEVPAPSQIQQCLSQSLPPTVPAACATWTTG